MYDDSILMACRDTGALCFREKTLGFVREKTPVFEGKDALHKEGKGLPHLPDPQQRLPLTLSPVYPCANMRSNTQTHAMDDTGGCTA